MNDIQTQTADFIATLNLNQWIIEKQLDGLTHEDSLLPLPFSGNRMNWVLGHLVEHRDWMLRAVDGKTLLPAEDALRYRRGSDGLTEDETAVSLDILKQHLQQSKNGVITAVQAATEPFLLEKPQEGLMMESQKERTRLQRLQGLLWHETYHVGQLELLRQLAGTNDQVLK